MDEILENLQKSIIKYDDYLNDYKLMKEMYKNFNDIINSFIDLNVDLFMENIRKVNYDNLIRLFVLLKFFDSDGSYKKNIQESLKKYILDNRISSKEKYNHMLNLGEYIISKINNNDDEDIDEEKKLGYLKTVDFFIDNYLLDDVKNIVGLFMDVDFIRYSRILIDYKELIDNISCQKDFISLNVLVKLKTIQSKINITKYYDNYIDNASIYVLLVNDFTYYLKELLKQYDKVVKNERKKSVMRQKQIDLFSMLKNKINKVFISSKEVEKIINQESLSDLERVKILEEVFKSNSYIIKRRKAYNGPKEELIHVLNRYKYDYNKLSDGLKDKLIHTDLNSIENTLNMLNSLNIILSYDNITYILLNGLNIDFNKFNILFTKDYIDNDFINNYIDILIDSDMFNNLYNNIQSLKNYKLDINRIKDVNPKILVIDDNYLTNILKMYKLYDVDINNESIKNLINLDEFDIIDKFIEENAFGIYKKNKENIIKPNVVIKKIHILNLIDSKLDVNDILSNSFFIPNDMLDSVCYNKTDCYLDSDIKNALINKERIYIDENINNEKIQELNKYYKEDNCYNFDGVIISRNKVLRNLYAIKDMDKSLEDKLFNSIIYNSMLTDDDINRIKTIIYGKKYVKKINSM